MPLDASSMDVPDGLALLKIIVIHMNINHALQVVGENMDTEF